MAFLSASHSASFTRPRNNSRCHTTAKPMVSISHSTRAFCGACCFAVTVHPLCRDFPEVRAKTGQNVAWTKGRNGRVLQLGNGDHAPPALCPQLPGKRDGRIKQVLSRSWRSVDLSGITPLSLCKLSPQFSVECPHRSEQKKGNCQKGFCDLQAIALAGALSGL